MMILPRLAAYLWGCGFFLSLDFGVFPAPEFERLAAVLCVLAGAGGIALCGGGLAERPVCAPALSAVLLMLWFLVMFSAVWSVSPGTSLLYGGAFSVMPATVLGLHFASPAARDVFLRHALYGGAAVIATLGVWAVIQVFILPEYLVWGQVRHPFANPNAFAALLTLSLLVMIGLYLQVQARVFRWILPVGMVVTGAALAAIASQAATLTLTGGLLVMAVLSASRLSAKQIWPLLPVAIAIGLIGALMAMQPDKTDIVGRLSSLAGGDTRTWDNRIDIWTATWAMIAANPFLGTGYKTFFLAYPAFRLPSETYSGGFMAHSDPLQFWAELGIAGMILYYAAGALVVVRFCRWFRAGGRDPVTIALFAGCAAFITHSHVDFLLYTMPTMLAFALALAALVVRTPVAEEIPAVPFSFAGGLPVSAQAGLVLAPVAAILFFFVPLMVSDYLATRAGQMIFKDVDKFAETVNAANRIGMGLNARPYSMAVTVPIGILKVRSPAIPPEEQAQLFRQADYLIRAGLRQNRMNAALHYHRAELVRSVSPAIVPAGYPAAEESLNMALALNPLHLPSRLALAEIFLAQGARERALDILAAGLDWPYTTFSPDAYFEQTIMLATALGEAELASRAGQSRDLHNRRLQRALRQKSAVQALKDNNPALP